MSNLFFWPALALTALLAYLPALHSYFVKDDIILILSAQITWPNLLTHSWPGGFFRPTAEMLFASQYALFGLNALPYHALSLGAHALTTFFLYLFLLRLLTDRNQSRICALIFALHPLHTESVSWISGQMSLFAGLCTLLLLYLSCREHSFWRATTILITTIGLGFYESFAAAPILWVTLYGYIPRIRRHVRPIALTIATLSVALPTSAYFYWRFAILGLKGGNYTVVPSIETALTNLFYYLYLLIGGSAMGGRILYYQPTQIFSTTHFLHVFPPLFIASIILLVIISTLYVRRQIQGVNTRISKEALLPIIWLLAALLPALILPERPRRLAYTSVPAFAILVTASFSYLQHKTRHGVIFTRAGLLFYLLIMTATLYARNRDWQTASIIEREMTTLIAPAQECASVVIDAPNLLGDALFFNSLSTERWLDLSTGRRLPIYDAHQVQPHQSLPLPTCYFRYANGKFVSTNPETIPYYIRGKNWTTTPTSQPHQSPPNSSPPPSH